MRPLQPIWRYNPLVWGTMFVCMACSALGAPPTPRPERSLMGIPLLAPYSVVLRKLGQPSEIQVGIPYLSAQAFPAQSTQNAGGPSGYTQGPPLPGFSGPGAAGGPAYGPYGGPGAPSGMSSSPYGGMPGMPPGMPQEGGGPYGMPGMPQEGGGPYGMPGMPYGMSSPYGAPAGAKTGGRPGLAGGGPAPSFPGSSPYGMGAPGLPGMYGGTVGGQPPKQQQLITWWYHYPELGLHYSFLFNDQGRVIQIQAYGFKPSSKVPAPVSAEGITLGSPLSAIIRHYGWSSDGQSNGDYLVLRYGGRYQIAFQCRHNRVVGIVLGVAKP